MGNGRSEQGPSGMDAVRWNSGVLCRMCPPLPPPLPTASSASVCPSPFQASGYSQVESSRNHSRTFHLFAATSVGRYPERL